MSREKRGNIYQKVYNNEIDNEVKGYFNVVFIKKIVIIVFTLAILILSFINNDRILLFTHMFGTFLLDIDLLAILLYYCSLTLVFSYNFMYIALQKIYDDPYKLLIRYEKILDLPYFVFKTVAGLFFIFIFMFSPCSIVGNSMNPTLHEGERVICYGLFYEPKKDDIVVLNAKNYYEGVDVFYVKRVVATEGDTCSYDIDTGKFYVNDIFVESLTEGEYNKLLETSYQEESYTFVVPYDKAIVFGDNRDNSLDSRAFGLVDYDDIFGKVMFRISPFKFYN